jgi:glycosyltransferase involved in cell wall biosynthesis
MNLEKPEQRKLRVVHLVRGFSDYITEVVNGLAGLVESHLVLAAKDEAASDWVNETVHAYKSGAPRVASLMNIPTMLTLAWYIRRIQPDVIHFQSGVLWELSMARLFPRLPVVTTLHDVVNHPSHTRTVLTPQWFINDAIRVADAVVVHAPRLKSFLEQDRKHILGHRPVHAIPMGIMSRYGTGLAPVKPRAANVLLFGTIDSWKGVEVLVEAEPLIRRKIPHARTIIAGWCMNPPYYENLIRPDQAIERRFTRQTDEEVKELFHWADVLVLPYIEASQSAVLQTGMAFGIPMVVSRVGGLPDVIHDGENGLVVEPGNAGQLADAVVKLLTDQELRAKVIQKMAEERESIYNWEQIGNQLLGVYQSVVNAHA